MYKIDDTMKTHKLLYRLKDYTNETMESVCKYWMT
jgi:hypothetical protein